MEVFARITIDPGKVDDTIAHLVQRHDATVWTTEELAAAVKLPPGQRPAVLDRLAHALEV